MIQKYDYVRRTLAEVLDWHEWELTVSCWEDPSRTDYVLKSVNI